MLLQFKTIALITLLILCSTSAYSDEIDEKADLKQQITDYRLRIEVHKDDPEYWYELGLLYRQTEDFDSARIAFETALSKDPDFFKASIEIAKFKIEAGNLNEAYSLLSTVISKDRCNRSANPELEYLAHEWEDKEATRHLSLSIYDYLTRCEPENCDYFLYQGRLLSWMGRNKDAEASFKKGLEICPNYDDLSLLLGNIYMREGRWDEAEAIFANFPDQKEAVEAIDKIARVRKEIQDEEASHTSKAVPEMTIKEKIASYRDSAKTHGDSPQYWYELGLLYVKTKDLKSAQKAFETAISGDPDFYKALIELAKIDVEKGHLNKAYAVLSKIISEDPCNRDANPALMQLAHEWEENEESRNVALSIYDYLTRCEPKNCDYLFFQARLLSWMERDEEAQIILKKALSLCPDYEDLSLLLGSLYMREERWDEAEAIFIKFPERAEALFGLGKITLNRKCYYLAQGYFQKSLIIDPSNDETRKGLARALWNRMRFCRAKSQYLYLISKDPCDDFLCREYINEVKPYTNWAVVPNFSYTMSRESDPSLNAPAVRTLYVLSSLSLLAPINDRWRIDATSIFFRQREKDIYPPTGINYNVYMSGGLLTSHLKLCKDLRWDVFGKVIRAWGEGNMAYPFINQTSFEPGSYLSYNSDTRLFVLGGHYESYVIKNFNINRSELLRFAYTEARAGYKWKKWKLEPEMQLWVSGNFYRDDLNNKKHLEGVWLQSYVPFCKKVVTLFYTAEYSGFEKLNINYYSYKRQWLNIIGIKLHKDINTRGYVDFLFEQSFRSTRDLFLPIGNTVFVSPNLFVRGYRPTVRVGYRFKDKLEVNVAGHYYRDTFPYKDYNVNGNLLWYF